MKGITFMEEFKTECDDDPNNWTRKAMKVSGGEQWNEVYTEANKNGVIIVGG